MNLKNKINCTNINPICIFAVSREHNFTPINKLELTVKEKKFQIDISRHESPLIHNYDANVLDSYPIEETPDISTVCNYLIL